ncbi:MAG: 16S rRNA (uracil(1498)-N(3))-methyltransferase [Nostocoides sp.]
MSRPVFIAERAALAAVAPGSLITLAGEEARHVVAVRRMGPGEHLDLVDGAGRRVTGILEATAKNELTLVVTAVSDEPAPQLRFVLVQALAKGDRDERAVESATELGVDEIIPWQARRSVVRWRGERAARSRRRWTDTVWAAVKQSRRSWIPGVADAVDLAGLVERVGTSAATYVLHEEANEPLVGAQVPDTGDVLLVVGPEGGVAPQELSALAEAGARPVRLGTNVLRSSTAGPAGLAVLNASSRWR